MGEDINGTKPLASLLNAMLIFLALGVLGGCATTTSSGAGDPLEGMNRPSYSLTDKIDRTIVQPMARAYAKVTPEPAQTGITNFFGNLLYLNVMVNSFLQGKFKQGFSDASRIVVNSTVGVGGLIDVGTRIGLPAHREDLGQTLAVWGVGQGPYLFIPLLGPNTFRDTPDVAARTFLNPLIYIRPVIALPLGFLNAINNRANLLSQTAVREETAVDPYVFTREAYLQQRRFLIYDGNPPAEEYEDIFDLEDGN